MGFSGSALLQLCWDEPWLFGDPAVLISELLLQLKVPAEVRSVLFLGEMGQ